MSWSTINHRSKEPRPTSTHRVTPSSLAFSVSRRHHVPNTRPSNATQRLPFSIGPRESRGVICAAYCSNNLSRSVGLAFINIPIAEAVLTSISDSQFYPKTIHKIQMMEAARILMPSTMHMSQSGFGLRPRIEDELQAIPMVTTAKSEWSNIEGMSYVHRVAFKVDLPSLEFALKENGLSVCAFSAAMKYIQEEFDFSFGNQSVRIKYQPPADAMMISLPTIRCLELLQNVQHAPSKESIFGLLNRTTTPMGVRILRSNILQPSTRISVLNPRLDAVEELIKSDDILRQVQTALRNLKPLGDVEKLLTKLVMIPKDGSVYEFEQAINNILKLKSFLGAIPNLFYSLLRASSPLLVEIRKGCHPEPSNDLMDLIESTIDHHAAFATKPLELRNQRVHTVKHEVSASLDIQRRLYEEFNKTVREYVNSLQDELGINIILKYTESRKYYLRIYSLDFGDKDPPGILINKTRSKGFTECQTLKLLEYNERINQAVHGAICESDEVIKRLLTEVRPRVSSLFKYCESIALLDMLVSFTSVTKTYNYVRPHFQDGIFSMVSVRHPILDSRGANKCIPNDYFATHESRFQIITGQNMSGKSTYIRTVAMIHILAQIGCFVPASTARISVIHSLFARVSTDDNLEANLSTFSVEMREIAFILRNINSKSLAIVDELGRATSTRAGLAVAVAISEALIQSGATVFFATHFVELAHGLAHRVGVINRHLKTETQQPEANSVHAPLIKMLYRVGDGPETEQSYGIALAKAIGFPVSFIARAEHVADTLRAQAQANRSTNQEFEEAKRRKLVASLVRQLRLAHQSKAEDEEPWRYFKEIHDEFWSKMLVPGGDITTKLPAPTKALVTGYGRTATKELDTTGMEDCGHNILDLTECDVLEEVL